MKNARRVTHGQLDREQRSRLEIGPDASSKAAGRAAPLTRDEFSSAFDRCFDRVYAYVSRRVSDRTSCERIVSDALAANLDLLMDRGDERHELSILKAALDRLIGMESTRSLSVGAIRP